jgi:regulator of protease activity HflC (stomatin/prohibitin superfamily)
MNSIQQKLLWGFGTTFVVILLFFAFCFRVVGVGQVGIMTQFGKVIGEHQSGAFFKSPWAGFTTMNIQVQKEQQDAAAATKDLQSVTTTIAMNYHLTSATAFDVYKNIGVDYKAKVLDPALQEVVRATTSQYNASELISQRPQVATAILDSLQAKLAPVGITVDGTNIVGFAFSSQFNSATEQKQVAAQNAQKAQYDLQTAQLESQAQQVKAQTLTPEYLQLQAIQKWDGKTPTTMTGGSTIFSIPLQGQ